MATKTIRIIANEYTVHKAIAAFQNPLTGEPAGYQHDGTVHFKGDVLPESDVSPAVLEALDNEDHPSHEYVKRMIERVSDEPELATAPRLGGPFDGYEEMDEDEILALMGHLPSVAIQRVKEYEAAHEARPRIVNYVIGFGESPEDRQEGLVGSDLDEEGRDEANATKQVARLTTREVPEDGGPVRQGEGVTGTGTPSIPLGSIKAEEEQGGKRRSRRPRAVPANAKPDPKPDGDSK